MFDRTSALILSGDIHVPQKVGAVTYCGAPYPVRFNDRFQPRALVVLGHKLISEPLDNIRKWTVELGPGVYDDPPELKPGDQVKIIIKLKDSELGEWQEWKQLAQQYCREQGATLSSVQLSKVQPKIRIKNGITNHHSSVTPMEALEEYCRRNKVKGELVNLAKQLLEEGS